VIETKKISLQELPRTLLNESNLPKYFWVNAVNTTFYALDKIFVGTVGSRRGGVEWSPNSIRYK